MKEAVTSQYQRFNRLAQMGVLLAGEQHLPRLYDLIVQEAQAITNARMGILLMREGDTFLPAATQTQLPLEKSGLDTFAQGKFKAARETLCGEVLKDERILNLEDVRTLPEGSPAALWPEFVHFKGNALRSLLALPLKTPQSGYLGILVLLNAHTFSDEDCAFDPQIEEMMLAVSSQCALAIQNVRWTAQLHEAYQDTLYRLSLVAKYREDPSGAQIRRVSQYCGILAGALGLPAEKVEKIRVASALYDIGKLGIPEAILLKPGKLTPAEFDQMKQHTTLGAVILGGSKTEILQIAERIAVSHHERFDGGGYPYGQSGIEIPLEGRIAAVAEVFDALTSQRPYKAPMPFDQAVTTIQSESGTHFDPEIVQAFIRSTEEFRKVLQTTKP